MKESKFYMALCVVHTLVVGSLWLFLTNIVTLGLMMIPSFTAAFTMGKQIIYKEFDYHGSITRQYFHLVASHLKLMRYSFLNIMMLMNLLGVFMGIYTGLSMISYMCMFIIATILTFICFLCGYLVFVDEKFTLSEAAVFMFYKPMNMILLIALHLLFLIFMSGMLLFIFAFAGAGILYAISIIVCSQSLSFKKRFDMLHEEDYRFKIRA